MDDTAHRIPDERPLTAEEHRLARWILEHGVAAAGSFLAQLDRARVVSRCSCGCPSIDFGVDGEPVPGGAPFVLGDFLFGEPDDPCGVFVFQRGGRLAGLDVYALAAEDPPRSLPRREALRPFDDPGACAPFPDPTLEGATMTRSKQALGLAGWLAASFAAAAVGGVASASAGSFYAELVRPGWAPPASLFGPVWSVLYVLQGVAAWLVWRARGFGGARAALGLFGVQLAANALWTWLFFAWRQGALALAEILVLWALIVATIVAFGRVRPLAGALLLPYLLWVSFATALTWSVWRLNPQLLG